MKKKRLFYLIIVLLILLIPLRALFNKGMFKSDDGEIHIARLANFYISMSEGNIFPRWGAYLNNGYGHPTLMFLYPLPNYFGSLIHGLGFSFINSIKILFAAGYVLSGIFMFLFLRNFFNKYSAFLGTMVYLYTPYRFVDIYVRGALPEHLFFMLAPLSLCLFHQYFCYPSRIKFLLVSLSLALLILVHNASSFIFFPFMLGLLLCIYLSKSSKQSLYKNIFLIILPFITALLLSMFYWYPAIFEGKYTLRHLIINKEFTISHLMSPLKLIIPDWGYGDPRFTNGLSVQIGLFNLAILIIYIILFLARKVRIKLVSLYVFIIYIFSMFLMTSYSKFIWESNNILFNIHFPWRLLVIIVFTGSLLAAIVFDEIIARQLIREKFLQAIVLLSAVILMILSINYQMPEDYFDKTDNYFINEYSGTADNGESSPVWSTLNSQYAKKSPLESIEGQIKLTNITKKSQLHLYDLQVETDKARIVDNTLYFPGWTVYDNDENITQKVEFQDPNYRGLITFWLNKGGHHIKVELQNTKVRKISELLSILGFGIILLPFKLFKRTKNEYAKLNRI